ncbi:MAG: carbohydrate binding family 9 domain-containing protein [Acidobacteria bacterium]|nr:carbohydrate binding family 9 domain-containing protein [Acidobacteriota bacterium]
MRLPAVLSALLFSAGAASAQTLAAADPPAGAAVPGAVMLADGETRPVLDGRVTDDAWTKAPPYGTFTQQDPDEGQPASQRTEVRILLDRTNVYIGVICYDDNPSAIVVNQSRRDADLNETDSIQLIFDTFHDSQNGFVFGTNPMGVQADGQVAGEGQTSGAQRGSGSFGSAGGGAQRGGISGFNANWDGDWAVESAITERGWEAEFAIPLRTLRYSPGRDRTWGFNVQRNIRRRNEQAFLAPIPRGYNLFRVSLAAPLTGLDLPQRRELKLVPFVSAGAERDYTTSQSFDGRGSAGLDVKWGITPQMTADLTINTDFAQIEADDEQINLTRFPVFFPEKRQFFLENASIFQFGNPQQIDYFFSRRIGLSASGVPIDIVGGGRVTGKAGGWNVGAMDIQTEETFDARSGALIAPANNFSVARAQREFGRSNVGGIFVNRSATTPAGRFTAWNRVYGLDTAIQVSQNGKLFAFAGRSDTEGPKGSDYSGRLFYTYSNPTWAVFGGHAIVGEHFNAEVGFVPRVGAQRTDWRIGYQGPALKNSFFRRTSPHTSGFLFLDLDGQVQTKYWHLHFFEMQLQNGGRVGYEINLNSDRPLVPFTIADEPGRSPVVIPAGYYSWAQGMATFTWNPSAPVFWDVRITHGNYYDGTSVGTQSSVGARWGDRFRATVGINSDSVDLPYGSFTTLLMPIKATWAFNPLTTLAALVQYNNQTRTLSSNVRLAVLDRSGTGLFVVFNDKRDTTRFTPEVQLGRSFIVKYARLFDF